MTRPRKVKVETTARGTTAFCSLSRAEPTLDSWLLLLASVWRWRQGGKGQASRQKQSHCVVDMQTQALSHTSNSHLQRTYTEHSYTMRKWTKYSHTVTHHYLHAKARVYQAACMRNASWMQAIMRACRICARWCPDYHLQTREETTIMGINTSNLPVCLSVRWMWNI